MDNNKVDSKIKDLFLRIAKEKKLDPDKLKVLSSNLIESVIINDPALLQQFQELFPNEIPSFDRILREIINGKLKTNIDDKEER